MSAVVLLSWLNGLRLLGESCSLVIGLFGLPVVTSLGAPATLRVPLSVCFSLLVFADDENGGNWMPASMSALVLLSWLSWIKVAG